MEEDAGGSVWVEAAHVPVDGVRDVPYRHVVVPGWDIDVGHTGERARGGPTTTRHVTKEYYIYIKGP